MITIAKLQSYIKSHDYKPDLSQAYFMKLAEEVGELSCSMRKNATQMTEDDVKGTIGEEIYDVIYYALAIANCYDIDVEKCVYLKEKINDGKYSRNLADTLLKD